MNKGCVYYTDNHCEERIAMLCRKQLSRIFKGEIISVSHYPINFGRNIVVDYKRSAESIFKQVLMGLSQSTADIVYLCEHDILYHESHFSENSQQSETIYYNTNRCAVYTKNGHSMMKYSMSPSMLVANRGTLVDYYSALVEKVGKEGFSQAKFGFAPASRTIEGMKRPKVRTFTSEFPNIDFRHDNNFTRSNDDRSPHAVFIEDIPYWGKTNGRVDEFLREVDEICNLA